MIVFLPFYAQFVFLFVLNQVFLKMLRKACSPLLSIHYAIKSQDFKRLLCKTLFIITGKFYKTIEYCTLNLPNNNIFPTSIFHIRSWDFCMVFCKAMPRQKFWTKMNCIKVSFQNYKILTKEKLHLQRFKKIFFFWSLDDYLL